MKRISPYTENRIKELWFAGHTRDAIGRQVGVSGSTVSEVAAGMAPSDPEFAAQGVPYWLSFDAEQHKLESPARGL
jgi:hypothetical protein